jgi:hypothetical protein
MPVRAREFVVEVRKQKLSQRLQHSTVGLNTFHDTDRANSDYVLNRVMMAAALADGSSDPVEINAQSWVGKERTAQPYTELEQKMMIQAFKAAGANYTDLNKGDTRSLELPNVNKISPVKPFKGYPR